VVLTSKVTWFTVVFPQVLYNILFSLLVVTDFVIPKRCDGKKSVYLNASTEERTISYSLHANNPVNSS